MASNPPAKTEKKKAGGRLPATVTNKQTIQLMMRRMDTQLQHMLPNFIDSRKLLAVLLSACQRQPKLFQCSTRSFIGALLECAMVGLYPDGSLGHAWFVPFKDKRGQLHAQLIIGYKGYQTLALNTGQVSRIKAVAVHEGDEFSWQEGTDAKIVHRPKEGVIRNANTLTHVYAYAKLIATPDDPQFIVLTKPEIDSVMNRSQAGQRGPWGTDYVAMARKTAINRVCNTLQLSPDLSRATTLDDMAASGINQRMGASPLLQDIGADLQLPEPEDFPDDDDGQEAVTVEMPRALPKGQRNAPAKPADPDACEYCEGSGNIEIEDGFKDCTDCDGTGRAKGGKASAPVVEDQDGQGNEIPPETGPDSASAEPQSAPDDNQTAGDTSNGGLFPDASAEAEKPKTRKRPWKPKKGQIDTLQQGAEDSGWTLDQLAEYVQETFGCGLAGLKTQKEYDTLLDYVKENTP